MRRSSLASRAQAIQRKRIHSLSTGGGFALACTAALVGAGCGSQQGAPNGAPLVTASLATPECDQSFLTCKFNPNTQGTVTFVVTQDGRTAAGQTVSFALAPPSAGGATLEAASGVTDAAGKVAASIRMGLITDFVVEAQIGQSEAKVSLVVESSGDDGKVLVAPFLAPSSSPPPEGYTLEVVFFDGSSCSHLNLDQPFQDQGPSRMFELQGGLGDAALVDFVGTGAVSSAIAQVRSATSLVVAKGCVDIPGSSLQPGGTVEVSLPLYDAIPDPIGTYSVTTTLISAPPLAAAAALAGPWTDLSDCPLDPAQRWLDFTVNALSPATSADPLALGQAIAALRGVPLVDGNGAPTGCRSAHDAGGAESLDALALGLFGTPLPAPVVALPAIADDAASLLDSVTLLSTMAVAPSSSPGTYVVTHTLSEALFGPTSAVTVSLASLALPTLQVFTSATAADDVLTIGSQGFTLRLGTAARAAFGPLSLVPRGLPADVPSFVTALFALAQSTDGTASGCAALDGVVCPAVAESAGCLTSACEAGLTALAAELDDAFSTADGTGLDLLLTAGRAPLLEKSGGVADRLGSDDADPSHVATWSVNLRTGLGSVQFAAPFQGTRN
ncbi:MAG TPA: hypothetical protein VI456_12150 [Polyangia bacterium]